jgi:competence protein ComEC
LGKLSLKLVVCEDGQYIRMKTWKYIFIVLTLLLAAEIIAIFQIPDKYLHIVTCNVGQGDAILVTFGKTQILTDGGPDKSVLDCLGKYMPFWDRNIELIVSTHPDADHATGLVSVIQNYNVGSILINPIDPGTPVYEVLEREVGSHGISVINPLEGMKLRVGLICLDIVSPTEELFSRLTISDSLSKLNMYKINEETNLYSIAYVLSLKNFRGLFLGDAPPEVSDTLSTYSGIGTVNYIKIPHHGSVNGLTENLLKAVVPEIAVISLGKNPWGFPRPEILDMLAKYNVKVLRTDLEGDVIISTEGNSYWVK